MSERGIDYSQLRDFLEAGQWREADQETAKRMYEVMNRQQAGWLNLKDIKNFPCADLKTIDRLWSQYSNGQFGFSAQKKIWQECCVLVPPYEAWQMFGDRVGWRKGNFLLHDWIPYAQVIFDRSAPSGHLPLLPARKRNAKVGQTVPRFSFVMTALVLKLGSCGIE